MEKQKKENQEVISEDIAEVSDKDVIKIPIGRFRENPWIISTIVLGLVLIGFVIFGLRGGVSGSAVNIVDEGVAASNLIDFIQSQGQVQGDVNLVSSEIEGGLYKVILSYQGQNIPVYVTLDGKYLVSDIIPFEQVFETSADDLNEEVGRAVSVDVGDNPVKGNENAPVTIVEFSDYECPFCGRFYSETLGKIDEKYIKTGKVKLVYKDFPLDFHPEAQKAAESARCVREQKGDDGYFAMHDKLFENQQSLSIENYKKWARELGVVGSRFDECLDSGNYADEVQKDYLYGQELGVTGTPGFFINGKAISGAQPYSVFEQIIENELNAV